MKIEEIRKQLTNLKIHIDQIEDWTRQATDLIYQIEENIFYIQDKEYCQKYEMTDTMEFFKDAASGIHDLINSPPRLNSSRCSKDNIAADGFYQSDFNLKKIV